MKINEIALRFLGKDFLKKIEQFDHDDTWDVITSTIELVSEQSNEAIDKILKSIIKKSDVKDTKDQDSKEEGFNLKILYGEDDDFDGHRRRRRYGGPSIQRAISFASNKEKKKKIIKILSEDIEQQLNGKVDLVLEKLNEISKFFNLKETEIKFLVLVYHETVNHRTGLGNIVKSGTDVTEIFTGCTSSEASNLCSRSNDNPLVLKGLMKFGHRNTTILSEMVLDFINKDAPLNLTEMFLDKENLENCFPLSSFKLSDTKKATLCRILKNSDKANILLYGLEGTGKTEFAKSICHELKVNCYFLRPFNDKGSDSLGQRRMGLFAATNLLPNLADSVLIVDEADKLLATNKPGGFFSMFLENVNDDEKAWTNQFLDQSKIKIIFIINKNSLDRSTLRRFNLMLEFDALSSDQTSEVVAKILKEKDLRVVEKDEIKDFIEENPGLNIGSYALAAETASGEPDELNKKETFFQVLKSHHETLGNTGSKRTLASDFDETLLNLSTNPEKIIEAVKRIKEGKSHAKNLPMLFYGAPGTGKTEFAHQLAKRFGMTLDVYGGSELLDPYVGGTEKQIAKAFKKSSSDPNKILFIDEADSLFVSRASAERSWMISQTNELLRQMENHRGIFIAATNFNTLMDEAAMRRFHLKVEFRALTSEKLLSLYELKFKDLVGNLSNKQIQDLRRMTSLTPGDIHAVWSRVCYEDKISHDEIISELKRENSFKLKTKRITLE